MGFDLAPGVSRLEATQALARFAFRELGCMHMEMIDRGSSFAELEGARGRLDRLHTYELDLRRDEDELFAGLTSACRRAIRKGEREGLRVEEAHGVEFADEYYEQLLEVFARQEMKPPYGLERVRELIRCVEPTGGLLLLRAVDPDGAGIATAIFPFAPDFGYFWGGASWEASRNLRPNEAIFWHAIRRFRERDVAVLNFGGGGDFKRKFGAPAIEIPILRRSRVPGLLSLRDLAARVYKRRAMRPAPRPGRAAEPFPRFARRLRGAADGDVRPGAVREAQGDVVDPGKQAP
jgi:hypothetical protein